VEERTGCRKVSGWKVSSDIGAPTHLTERLLVPTQTIPNTFISMHLFLLEAQLFHGCTRKEALMLWNDGIDTLYDCVESTQAERMDK
jgi:hypothetical protein